MTTTEWRARPDRPETGPRTAAGGPGAPAPSPSLSPLDRLRGDRAPLTGRRLGLCYLISLLALVGGGSLLVLGWVAADHCTAEGFGCLGYFLYGAFGACLAGPLILLALSLALRVGIGFWTVMLTILVPSVPLGGLHAFLIGSPVAPVVAAWVALPARRTPSSTAAKAALWALKIGVLALVTVGLPWLESFAGAHGVHLGFLGL